jgi:mevalonate kinase
MIPLEFHDLWRKGIETNTYYLKLCGSGGGGFMLGFTEDYEATEKALKGYRLEVVYHF